MREPSTSTKTRPPFLLGDEDARGSPHRFSPNSRWLQRRLDAPGAFRVGSGSRWPRLVRGADERRRRHLKHVRISTYEIKRGSFEELADVAQDEMLREFSNQPGFIRYGLAEGGDRTCISISLWETRKDADAASTVSAAWDRDHVADRVELKTNQIGDLALLRRHPGEGLIDPPALSRPARALRERGRDGKGTHFAGFPFSQGPPFLRDTAPSESEKEDLRE